MNLGGEAADQVVRYSLEGLDHSLRLSGTAAKNLAVFLAALLKNNKKSYGKICMARMLKENRPLKFFMIPSKRIHEFAKEGKKRGLPYVVIRDRKNPQLCELMVFADDAAKVNRVMDKMNLDFLKSESCEAVQEVAGETEKTAAPEQEIPVITETVEMPEGEVQFELGSMENDFNFGNLTGEAGNFTQAKEERNLSDLSSRNKDIFTGQDGESKRASVREELNQIKQEKQEAGRKKKQRNKGRSGRRNKKKIKNKGKGR